MQYIVFPFEQSIFIRAMGAFKFHFSLIKSANFLLLTKAYIMCGKPMSTGCTVYVYYTIYCRAVRKFSILFAEKGLYSSFKLPVVTEHVLFLRSIFVAFDLCTLGIKRYFHWMELLEICKKYSWECFQSCCGVYSWCRHGLDNALRWLIKSSENTPPIYLILTCHTVYIFCEHIDPVHIYCVVHCSQPIHIQHI